MFRHQSPFLLLVAAALTGCLADTPYSDDGGDSDGNSPPPAIRVVPITGSAVEPPVGALSGLAAGAGSTLYAVHDDFYHQSHLYEINTATTPAHIRSVLAITDPNGVFAANSAGGVVNHDGTLSLDLEGIAVAADGGFWVVSEGKRPVPSRNWLIKLNRLAVVKQLIALPAALNAAQRRFGFEGVAADAGKVFVAFQRAWGDEAHPRIGVYDLATQGWRFVYYPLDSAASPRKSKVSVSALTALGNGQLLVLERDNRAEPAVAPAAAIRRIYRIDLSEFSDGQTVGKTLWRDLADDLRVSGGWRVEKLEGMARDAAGNVWLVNDNDGVDGSSGTTRLFNIGSL